MQSILVSIIMPAFNAERYIGAAIESVLEQSYPQWELIVVNDGSKDGTSSILSKFHDKRIKIISQLNGGEAVARNTALKAVSGEYLAFLDADDLFLPQHLETTVEFLQAHPEYDGVYSDGFYIRENGEKIKTLSSRRRGPFKGDIFEEMVRSSDVFGAPVCVVLRTSVIAEQGLDFDPSIVIGPDWDFFIRFSEVAQFGYIQEATCLYRVHSTNISLTTGSQKRLLSLARCREKAIKMRRFKECSVDTRVFVFYDLLIHILGAFPEKQMAVLQWQEFEQLPVDQQAHLFRLVASSALQSRRDGPYIREWLVRANALNRRDRRGFLIYKLYLLNPRLCQLLLSFKKNFLTKPLRSTPFGDLV